VKVPSGVWSLVREAARHLLRRPVVGVVAAARTRDGRWLLIRRGDTGDWALPGGTLEWGETLRSALARELWEEAGVTIEGLGGLSGVYSRPDRDPRFHAVTIAVHATVSEPSAPPKNPVEIREVRLFADEELPADIGMGMRDMLDDARAGNVAWE
jgi:8-oxo-dGTP diphosphatase